MNNEDRTLATVLAGWSMPSPFLAIVRSCLPLDAMDKERNTNIAFKFSAALAAQNYDGTLLAKGTRFSSSEGWDYSNVAAALTMPTYVLRYVAHTGGERRAQSASGGDGPISETLLEGLAARFDPSYCFPAHYRYPRHLIDMDYTRSATGYGSHDVWERFDCNGSADLVEAKQAAHVHNALALTDAA
ncbi:hypothetical protein BDZ89DRAFT_1048503 [Hymenopellis radicata]|nr:hypothetical protein BDZ89DRAFT_1048503 [Hymenopellis radicata]